MSSKVIHNPKKGEYAVFELKSFDDAVDAKEDKKRKLEEEFKPLHEGRSEKEFVLGGFNFEYSLGYRADEIMKKTTDEVEKMIADANARVAEIEKAAHDKGFHEGHDQGRKEGFKEVEETIKSLKETIVNLLGVREEYYRNAEKEMVDMIMHVASEITHKEITQDKNIILDVVRKSVKGITTQQAITIRLNPLEIEIVKNLDKELIQVVEQVEGVKFAADPAVTEGGCVVETNIGTLDATVESRLIAVFRILREQVGR